MNRYFDSYSSDPRRIQYAGSETDGFSVGYKVIEFSLAKLQLITPKRIPQVKCSTILLDEFYKLKYTIFMNLKSATIIQYTIKGRFMSR